ncbi:DUF6676 family protein [Corynebacterium nasicanis]|uniref:DUF6676 family protein n=1 Tax=Corynebacterium nasicanis TaxID=1448267 RepID=A0ABW1QBP9_9CORY
MIPEGVDIDDLASQLGEDSVAFSSTLPVERVGELEPGLIDAVAHAEQSGFGSLGVVVLEHTPAHVPDLRDIAQDLLLDSGLETVVVRTPDSGAIVSDLHSRGAIESAQYRYLGDPDVVGATFRLVDDLNGWSVNWPVVTVLILAVIVAGSLATAWTFARRSRLRA